MVVQSAQHAREAVPFRVGVIQIDLSQRHRFAIAGLHCATLELVRDEPGPVLA